MVAATYVSDLTDIFLFESTTGVSAYGGGAGGLGTGADFAMEGTLAVDKQITSAEKGFLYDNGANFTIGADDHFYIWIMGATPGINDTRDNRGIVVGIGDSTTAFVKFHMDGSDTLPLGGGQSYAVRYVNTTLANFRTLVGSPSTAPSQIGGGLNTTASAKAANLGVDGARIGTGYDITNGTGADAEADFAGIAADVLNGFVVIGQSVSKSSINLTETASIINCTFKEATITGTLDGSTELQHCHIGNLNYTTGNIQNCQLNPGVIKLGTTSAAFINCWSGIAGVSTPVIDFDNNGANLIMRNYSGGIDIRNKTLTGDSSIELDAGQVILEPTVTAGSLSIRGIGKLIDNSVGATILNEILQTSDIALARDHARAANAQTQAV